MQKPNVEAEVYNNNKKCDGEKKGKKKLKRQLDFIMPTKPTTKTEEGKKGKKEKIKSKMDEYSKYRKEKQPIEFPSAGSTFKRGTDFITAKLIDEAGLKGYSIGGAKISEKHAGFVINTGNATARDVLELVEYVTKKVYEKFEKKIELEIKVVGE